MIPVDPPRAVRAAHLRRTPISIKWRSAMPTHSARREYPPGKHPMTTPNPACAQHSATKKPAPCNDFTVKFAKQSHLPILQSLPYRAPNCAKRCQRAPSTSKLQNEPKLDTTQRQIPFPPQPRATTGFSLHLLAPKATLPTNPYLAFESVSCLAVCRKKQLSAPAVAPAARCLYSRRYGEPATAAARRARDGPGQGELELARRSADR